MVNRWLILAILITILGAGWTWLSRVPTDAQVIERQFRPATGHLAPTFTLQTLEQAEYTLTVPPERPVVLNFWATWCAPCRNELPTLQMAAERYDGVVDFVIVDQAEPPDVVQQYVDELGLTMTVPMDLEQNVANLYRVQALPTTFFIDGEGVIRSAYTGEMNSITLAENIARIR